MKIEIHALTHPGRRAVNEDALLVDGKVFTGRARKTYSTAVPEEGLLIAVADGVSGAPCAALASRRVLRELALRQSETRELRPPVLRAVQRQFAEAAFNTPCFGMAACVAAVHLTPSRVALVHAGDCRIYLARDDELQLQTADHTAAAGMIRRGDAPASFKANHASVYLGVESAVVADPAEADFEIGWNEMTLTPRDCWLLTTDGAHGAFAALDDAGQLTALLTSHTTPQRVDAISRLHSMSHAMTSDNSSLIALYAFE